VLVLARRAPIRARDFAAVETLRPSCDARHPPAEVDAVLLLVSGVTM
jgi:hypothetical protein